MTHMRLNRSLSPPGAREEGKGVWQTEQKRKGNKGKQRSRETLWC